MKGAGRVVNPASGGKLVPAEKSNPNKMVTRSSWATQPVVATGWPLAAEQVDLILLNGNIYTVNEKQPRAEAIAVKNQRVVFVGSNAEAKKFHAARRIDL